jgi:type I restriction enzyme, S subunit
MIKDKKNKRKRLNLSDVAFWGSGGTPSRKRKDYFLGDIPWIKTGELGKKFIYDTEEKITKEAINNSSAKIFPSGSVAIAMYGATIGKTSILKLNAATNQACAVAQPYDFCNSEFLYYFLVANQDKFVAMGTGGAQPNISQTLIKQYTIDLPPLLEQKRIVAKIESLFSRLDSAKDSLVRMRAEIKRYRQSVLKSAYSGKLSAKAVEFEHKEVKDISENIQYGYTASAKADSQGIKFLRITDIQNGVVNWKQVPSCDISKEKYQKCRLFSNDIVFARTGATVGKTFLIKGDIPKSVFASYLIRVKLKKEILPEYVYLYFQSIAYWRQITDGQVGIGQPNVNGTRLGLLIIPVCSMQEQIKIVEAVESSFERAKVIENTVEQGLEKIERLKQSVLKRAFEGKLVEPDPNDESVEVLLERIKKEKAKFREIN